MSPINKSKKKKKNISLGIVHIKATFNNTIVTVTDTQGNVIAISTAGSHGFKGAKKLLLMKLKSQLIRFQKKQRSMG